MTDRLEIASAVAGFLSEPALFVDPEGGMRGGNACAVALFGDCGAIDAPRPVSMIARPSDRDVLPMIRRAARVTTPIFDSIRLSDAHGTVRWYRADGARVPQLGDDPSIVMLRLRSKEAAAERFMSLNDQLRRAKAHAAFERRIGLEMREANLSKTGYLAQMSHDLRSTLNAVIGFAQLLEADDSDEMSPRRLGHARMISAAGKHLLSVVDEVMEAAILETGVFKLNEAPFDLVGMLRSAVAFTGTSSAGESDSRLDLSLPVGLPPVMADEAALRRVAINLLDNALKFTPPGGQVSVSAGVSADGEPFFDVTDTGPGVPAKDIARLFNAFERGSQTKARAARDGAGLGLAISRRITELHGGAVLFDSALGRGTTVRVVLPSVRRIDASAA